jgi:hypothetical protein
MYRLSEHARERIRRRHLRPQDLVAALDGLEATRYDGTLLLCDARSLCTLIVNPHNATILTAYKMKPVKFRRIFRNRKHS